MAHTLHVKMCCPFSPAPQASLCSSIYNINQHCKLHNLPTHSVSQYSCIQLQKTFFYISLHFLSGSSEVCLNIWYICRLEYNFCAVENSAHHYPSSSSFSERQLSSVLARSAQARSLRDPRMLGGLVLVRAHARHLCYLPARPVHSCCQACDAVFCPTTGAGGGGGGVGPSHPRLSVTSLANEMADVQTRGANTRR